MTPDWMLGRSASWTAGRTAAGPVLTAPQSGTPCVAYRTVEVHERYVSDNYVEKAERGGPRMGDEAIHGPGGARIVLDPDVGRRRLFLGRPAVMGATWSQHSGDWAGEAVERTEYVVSADEPVVALGVIWTEADTGRYRLARGDDCDGSAYADPSALTHRCAVDLAARSALAVTCACVALLLGVVFGW